MVTADQAKQMAKEAAAQALRDFIPPTQAPSAKPAPADAKAPAAPPAPEKAKAGWQFVMPTWFFSILAVLVLVILGVFALRLVLPGLGSVVQHGVAAITPPASSSNFTPNPEAARHPALVDAFDASRVSNTKDGIALKSFPPDVVAKIRAGARAVLVTSTNKVWSLYPPPYSPGDTAIIP